MTGRNHLQIMRSLLLLSGDICTNPGPVGDDNRIERMWRPFKSRGMHLNSLLPKIDEVESIAIKSKASVIGITESKLDDTVADKEHDLRI